MKSNLSSWISAARVPTLTASVIPVVLGGILAYNPDTFHLSRVLLAVVSMTFFQITSNLINDVDDFNNKVDTKESFGSSRVVVDGLLTQKQVLTAAWIFFGIAIAIGIYLSVIGGLVILILGLLGAAGTYFYTREPFSFKYRGLGIPVIFVMFGPLPVLGSYYLSAGVLSFKAALLSIPVGLLTTAILHANDLRDIEHDAKAGVKSLAIILGNKKAGTFYLFLIIAAFVSTVIFIFSGLLTYWSMLVLLAGPLAIMLIRTSNTSDKIKVLDRKTAALQMTFGVLLLISVTF
ncbi:1,4-dihydroxy-2-naphthoate prenyltransferase [Sporobacter termitidis DSM 10068]|uniref:1,4-dihydroxy-2-naphthoate octaprenyltransferase n=1 Tax=Sporobacter termitidis DSM 10068 TaxID=1123282 RepID=A0A1M5XXE2_9FIRM|nr:1,4-dihydroxy-2-naphthoate octaprenyltransferase [Sporobacter termitidis]SHI03913.1 1,4-dihydroxy-2-naphthoate prenyltransferase [Sporobacter termitidis DSM 10068]